MITEIDKDTIYFSSLFARHYPELYGEIKDILTKNGCPMVLSRILLTTSVATICLFRLICSTISCIYDPDYLKEEPEYTTDIELVLSTLKR